jgi:CHAT domain-containing protein
MLQSQEQLQTRLHSIILALGNYTQTIKFIEQFRVIIQKLEQKIIPILGDLYYLQGQEYFDKSQILEAVQFWLESLTLYQEIDDRQGQMRLLQYLGNAYNNSFYNRSQAIDYLQQSLDIAEELKNEQMQGRLLADLSAAHLALAVSDDNQLIDSENYFNAISYAQQSLIVAQKCHDIQTEWLALDHLGDAYFLSKEYKRAIETYQQILKIVRQSKLPTATMQALHNLGEVYLEIQNYTKANLCFCRALKLAQELKNPQQEAMELVALGRVAKQQENISEAINFYKQGIQIAEKIRSTIKIEENTASFANFWARHYRSLILLLWQESRFPEAFDFVERSKARAFLDKLANGRIDFRTKVKARLLNQEQKLRKEIFALRRKDPNHLLPIREQAYKDFLEKLEIQNPGTASLLSVDVAPLAEIQQQLDDETTLVEYFVTDKLTLAFIITRDRCQGISLNVTREKLKEQITLFRDFADTSESYPLELKNLYTFLIAPLKSQLNTPKLVIVPHNILHYLPFASLTDGERYLIDDYALVNLPCANVLRFLPKKHNPSAKTLLALGAPENTFDKSLPPLNAARKQVEAIARLFNTKAYIGKYATESLVWSQAKNAKIVLIAAHGEYNPNAPLFSTIHLAMDDNAEVAQKDGRLEVHDVYRLDLITTNLVVLSACQTLIGNTQKVSLGDEVIGLNRAFIYAGTPTVIASLWNVEDETTRLLMEQLFHNYLQAGMSKAKALQQAQIEVRKNAPHPYFWAAFVLTGDGGLTNG